MLLSNSGRSPEEFSHAMTLLNGLAAPMRGAKSFHIQLILGLQVPRVNDTVGNAADVHGKIIFMMHG
jgi:hypothetical protein